MSEPKSPGWARAAQIGLGAIAVILYNSTSLPGDKRQAIWFLMYLSKKNLDKYHSRLTLTIVHV